MVVAAETGQILEKLPSAASPIDRDQSIVEKNPTGKVPTALMADGSALYDSRVICRWLDEQHNGPKLYPTGDTLWTVLRHESLADGLLDAALLARYETAMRPADKLWPEWLEGQMGKINSSLDAMETEANGFNGVTAGLIAIACAVAYLDFRFPDLPWRGERPALTAWFADFSNREAMVNSAPH